MITADEILKPVSEENPCGENLSNDPALLELETLMKGKPETQFSKAEDPNWKVLRERCVELLGRSKDLRVMTALCLAQTKMEGLAGLKESLSALKTALERYWEPIHPKLDPEDGNDPLQRMNIIAGLATSRGTFGDPMRFLDRLCEVPLTNSIQLGKFGFGDVLRSQTGEADAQGTPAPAADVIAGAFRDTNPEALKATRQLVLDMLEIVKGIDAHLTATVGASRAPSLEVLLTQFKDMDKAIVPYIADGSVSGAEGETAAQGDGQGGAGTGAKPITGEIQSRQDVLKMLEKICQYYARTEPASPVPGVIKRAKRLAEMTFMEIIKDMCPDAESTVRTVTGEKEEES